MDDVELVNVGKGLNDLGHDGSSLGFGEPPIVDDEIVKILRRAEIEHHVEMRIVFVEVVEVDYVRVR